MEGDLAAMTAFLFPREGEGAIPSGEIRDVRQSKVHALCAFPPLAVDIPFPLNLSEARTRRASRSGRRETASRLRVSEDSGCKARLSPPEAARIYPVWGKVGLAIHDYT